MIPVIVHGVSGRMGRRIVDLSKADARHGTVILAGIVRRGHSSAGSQFSGVPVVDSFDKALCLASAGAMGRTVVIDFSTPAALSDLIPLLSSEEVALVSGTTGLDESQLSALREAGKTIPVVWAANMSLGVHLLSRLVAIAARALPEADLEIVETHHRHKVDAPSGTALRLAEIARQARPKARVLPGRTGSSPGGRGGDIGVHSIRMGEVVGDHQVHLALDHEIVTLGHRATSRDAFAGGALAAARYAANAAPGYYGMDQVLGLDPS